MSDRFAAPKKTKKLRKTVLKVNTDRKDEYIFFLEYVILHYQKKCRSKKQPEQLKRLKQPGSFSITSAAF